ncbi:MAG: hypothetical protein MR445_02890, partial [Erysipelotrichaceae bacterium]|nr:hypothetical protein [Erysipelotrichaceae bacterium]
PVLYHGLSFFTSHLTMLRKLRMIQLILSQTVSRPIFQDNIYRFSLMCFRIYMPSLTSTLPVSKTLFLKK